MSKILDMVLWVCGSFVKLIRLTCLFPFTITASEHWWSWVWLIKKIPLIQSLPFKPTQAWETLSVKTSWGCYFKISNLGNRIYTIPCMYHLNLEHPSCLHSQQSWLSTYWLTLTQILSGALWSPFAFSCFFLAFRAACRFSGLTPVCEDINITVNERKRFKRKWHLCFQKKKIVRLLLLQYYILVSLFR